jgi:hypothetical protein
MNDKSDQEQIINEAKSLNPDVSDTLVTEVGAFLNSDFNKSELNPSSLRQLSEKLLEKLNEPMQTNES